VYFSLEAEEAADSTLAAVEEPVDSVRYQVFLLPLLK
jgi:hypothetical protein